MNPLKACAGWYKNRCEKAKRELTIYSYPDFIHAWPVVLFGFLFYNIDAAGLISPKTEAWIYLTVVATVIITIGIDLPRNAIIFWLVLIGFCWTGALWLRATRGIVIFDQVLHYFEQLNPGYSRDFALILSIILSVVFGFMLFHARVNDKWHFSNNEIEHIVLGQNDRAIARGAKVVTTSYPDILEAILTLSGTLTIYDAQGQRVLAAIKNVPFLPFLKKRIDRILESVSVTQTEDDNSGGNHHEVCEDNDDGGNVSS